MDHDDSEFEQITRQVMADVAFDAYVASTAQMSKMLEVIVDMAASIAMRSKLHADAAQVNEPSASALYNDVFLSVWERTLGSLVSAAEQMERLRQFEGLFDDKDDDDVD